MEEESQNDSISNFCVFAPFLWPKIRDFLPTFRVLLFAKSAKLERVLLELRISNFALIERAEIAPGAGFNALTGETGAGKSILIQALGLLLGERAAAEQVGVGNGKAVVEGAFDVAKAPRARAWLEANGFPLDDDALIIAREVEASGRSRVRLNGRLATATALRELGAFLVDLHGQHENQMLLSPDAHLQFLDEFGPKSHGDLKREVAAAHKVWRAAARTLAELSRNEQERVQRLDTLQFQAEEIDKAKLGNDEDETLAEERARLMNAEGLRQNAALCVGNLWGDDEPGALGLARQSLKAAREIEATDGSVKEWAEALQSAILDLEDAAEQARAYAETLDADPNRLEQIESRLFKINRLKRKYGADVAAVLVYRANIESEIQSLNLSDEQIADLKAEAAAKKAVYFEWAEKLSAQRKELARDFAAQVVEQLSGLSMEKARFEIGFERLEKSSAGGIDRAEFLLSANPGQPLRPLTKIASGGEISRVMLGLRSVLRDTETEHRVPTVVFDEIDSGIGGLTAEKVGEKMSQIASHHQVFCITHLPQIAKRADHHFRVVKAAGDQATTVDITPLDPNARIEEMARMMGSESRANLEHARALLEDVAAVKAPKKRGKK